MENQNNRLETVLRGRIEYNTEYKIQPLAEYSNNPYIEVLPHIFSDEEIIDKFSIYPIINDEEKQAPINIKYHYIKRLKNFVQPLDIHFKIERKLSTVIRRGYIARNPVTNEYKERLRLIHQAQDSVESIKLDKIDEITESLRSTAEGFSITGISGMGKSVAIERLLMMYPQVIIHSEYNKAPFSMTQIVWLKLDTPHDGSIKTLCKMFFKAIDDILGTTYSKKFGTNRNSAATMMIHMVYLASLYAIGVIVIDEIQHLTNAKQDPEEILNFLVTLINTIGVPIIMIGTPSAEKILKKNFRQARRAGSIGSVTWERMSNDKTWEFFVETMWEYQWLEEKTTLSDKFIQSLYDHSQGITALAVIIFMLAQELALEMNRKSLNTSLFSRVSKTDLRLVQNMIQALRTNDIHGIAKYDDIVNDFDQIFMNKELNVEHRNRMNLIGNQLVQKRINEKNNGIENLVSEIISFGICEVDQFSNIEKYINEGIELGYKFADLGSLKKYVISRIMNSNNDEEDGKSKNRMLISDDLDLRRLFRESQESKVDCFSVLKREGWIKDPFSDFYTN